MGINPHPKNALLSLVTFVTFVIFCVFSVEHRGFLSLTHHVPAMMRSGRRVLVKRQAHAHEEAGACSERGRRMKKQKE